MSGASTVQAVFHGSDGEATKALYARLAALGPAGELAANLLRAQKCSSQAKGYRRRAHKDESYGRKNWSLQNICRLMSKGAPAATWGWKQDPEQEWYPWVLYVDLPTGQVSFHSPVRGDGPDYPSDWDGQAGASDARVIAYAAGLLGEPVGQGEMPSAMEPVRASGASQASAGGAAGEPRQAAWRADQMALL